MALPFLFEFWAMEHQLPPEGDWRSWVIMGGRGAGKTRAGAEWVRSMVEGARPMDTGRARRVAIVGETIDQAREVMVFGESGILACSPPDRRPDWQASRRTLVWPNGAEAQVFSAHDPEALRGPQFDAAWVDELGCAAIDKGANQPNRFLDVKSSESGLPRHSNGQRDEFMQMQYLRAVLGYWSDPQVNPQSVEYDGPMLDLGNAYVWSWDARPYPYFPANSTLWSDGENYARGHWLNGRGAARSVASVVRDICADAGVQAVVTDRLNGLVRGYVAKDTDTARAALQPLMLRHGFDAVERDGELEFRSRTGGVDCTLDTDGLVVSDETPNGHDRTRAGESDLSGQVRLRFVEAGGDFETVAEEAVLPDEETLAVSTSEFPLLMTRAEGRQVVERWLSEARVARDTIKLSLPLSMSALGAGDTVALPNGGLYRLDRVESGAMLLAEGVRIDPESYGPVDMVETPAVVSRFAQPVPVFPLFLDLPLLSGDEAAHEPHIAATATPWPGTVAVFQGVEDLDYSLLGTLGAPSVVGQLTAPLMRAAAGRYDLAGQIELHLTGGALNGVSDLALLNGANVAAIGDGSADNWEVIQFRDAELVAENTWHLRTLLRGQSGSEGLMPVVWPEGSYFVLLNGGPKQLGLPISSRNVAHHYRIGPALRGYDDPSYQHAVHAFAGIGLKPLAPVHLRADRHANGDLSVGWIRRTRVDGDGWEAAEVPLGEESETYHLRILAGGIPIREETLQTAQWIYSAAHQTQDGGQGDIRVQVAQVSARFGPGYYATLDLSI
ncbi:phage tail protein [Thalassovita sp.]|uniref:phage tail protein n=1 Tax=Thalassovita sp. TaxID=1979401 RepID=UPI0029DE847B|nr:phage tail protein [Thalassovita sp.]